MNNQQQQPTSQYPSLNGASEDLQYVPYYTVHQQQPNSTTPSTANQTTTNNLPTMYPWSGMNPIPFNYVPPSSSIPSSIVHNDVELQEVPMNQNLIPSSTTTTNNQDTTIPLPQREQAPRRSWLWKWRNCKHAQQKRFLKSLKGKTWTRIPRAVGVFSLLFIFLSIAFFLTIGKSADNHLNYRKSVCQVNTDQDNSVVHFDYDRGVYYLELNVSVAHRNLGPGGPGHDEFHPGHHSIANHARHTREIRHVMRSRPDSYTKPPKIAKKSFIMSRVCSYPLQQQTLDCRDRVIKLGEISCYIDEDRMRMMEVMDMFFDMEKPGKGHGGYSKHQPPQSGRGEKRILESSKPQAPPSNDNQQAPPQSGQPNDQAKPDSGKQGQQPSSSIAPADNRQPQKDRRGDENHEDVIATRETVARRFRRSLRCAIPGFLILSVVITVIFVIIGFKVLDGKSRRSCDRFIRQYFANPFEGTGEVYKLDEVSSSAVIIQDPKEPKSRTLLSSSTLQMENTPRQERVLQKRLSKFWKLMRSTATKATETLLLYEKPAKKNISCHGKKHGACNGKRKFGRILCVIAKVALILFVIGLIAYGTLHAGISIFKLKIFSGFLHLYFTLGVIALITWFALFKRRSVHYLITSERIVRVIELPLRLRMNLVSVNYEKIKSVWAEDNRIYLKTVNSKGMERSGLIFEHVIDPAFVVNMIQQRIGAATNQTTNEQSQQTEATTTTTETH
ncbi:predicted protein [Naegleria gruberi]|uniref:Predicted protein n=1 Tax=Naegleria gruberi TaxID=5762 RepID=D2VSG8_NAEGR|nr:uncharacterized protein NAEGRDRAFT_81069 [Naegleria gruberi]EFC40190.1 predicted protein [Naegleria gruberi]|eukprot:XP_002672934.1 predicted protein [Naegleria gruberi strain NEG-M]